VSVVVGELRGYVNIPNLAALGFESPSSAQADHKVWLQGLDCQVCCQSSRHCAHIIHSMDLALAYMSKNAVTCPRMAVLFVILLLMQDIDFN
jgi:hypothetical protein